MLRAVALDGEAANLNVLSGAIMNRLNDHCRWFGARLSDQQAADKRLKKKIGLITLEESTADAIDKKEHARIRCWNKNTQKNEMEISIENCDITE